MVPINKIKVINSRTRDEEQFALNVQSIEAIGQVKDIRVNDKYLASTGFYELIFGEGRLIAQQRLGQRRNAAAVSEEDRALYRAATRRFGNWTNALIAAGLNPSDFWRHSTPPGARTPEPGLSSSPDDDETRPTTVSSCE